MVDNDSVRRAYARADYWDERVRIMDWWREDVGRSRRAASSSPCGQYDKSPLSEGILGNLRSFAIPVLTLALVEWPAFMRILRSDAIVTLQQDYVLLAKAKGLRNVHILFRHVLKPSSFTLITVVGLTVATLIGGALVVETIFALPGVGRLLIGSINSRDFMMVQGAVALIAVGFVLVNFAIDTLYSVLDPRVAR